MAIVLTKKKITAPAMDPELAELQELIDRVGNLAEGAEKVQARIKKENERLKPYNDAMKELQAKVDEMESDPDEPLELLANVFRLEAGTKGKTRSIKDMDTVREMLGNELFMELATVRLKDVDAYLTPPQKKKVLAEERSNRKVKIARRAA